MVECIFKSVDISSSGLRRHRYGKDVVMESSNKGILGAFAGFDWKAPCKIGRHPVGSVNGNGDGEGMSSSSSEAPRAESLRGSRGRVDATFCRARSR